MAEGKTAEAPAADTYCQEHTCTYVIELLVSETPESAWEEAEEE